MNRKLIAIDCGKAETKVFAYDTRTGNIRNTILRSRVEPSNSLVKLSKGENAHTVTFGDPELRGEWTIGAIGGVTSYSNSKKDSIHKMLTLTAIALVTEKGDSVIASVGCPLSVYFDDAAKAEYYDYIFPSGRVEVTIDGQMHYFYVEKDQCLVFPESFGALFMYPEEFSEKTGVIDIGGLNVNASYFQYDVLRPILSRTEKLGYYSAISLLRSRLNAVCDACFDDTDVGIFLKQGYVTNNKDTAKVIDEVLDLQARRIREVLKEWEIDNMTIIFIGGTSILMKKQIEKHFGKKVIIPEEPNLVNCKGFLRAMIIGYGYKAEV